MKRRVCSSGREYERACCCAWEHITPSCVWWFRVTWFLSPPSLYFSSSSHWWFLYEGFCTQTTCSGLWTRGRWSLHIILVEGSFKVLDEAPRCTEQWILKKLNNANCCWPLQATFQCICIYIPWLSSICLLVFQMVKKTAMKWLLNLFIYDI